MKNDPLTSAEIRLAETLLGIRAADKGLSEIADAHLMGTYRRALAGDTDAMRELISLLVATYSVGGAALVLAKNHSPQEALALAADYLAASADERDSLGDE